MRVAIAAVTVGAAVAVGEIALLDALDAGELFPLIERDERYALRGAAHLADLRHRGADEDAAGGDEHDLVLLNDEHRADDGAVTLRDLDRDHALPPRPWRGYSAIAVRLP